MFSERTPCPRVPANSPFPTLQVFNFTAHSSGTSGRRAAFRCGLLTDGARNAPRTVASACCATARASALAAQFVCIVFLTVALVPAGAHLFELPNKLAMAPHDYLVAQASYRGWALSVIVVAGAVALSGLHAYLVRANRAAFRWSLIALACLAAAQIIFWTFTNPVNVLTDNWTSMPADLEFRPQAVGILPRRGEHVRLRCSGGDVAVGPGEPALRRRRHHRGDRQGYRGSHGARARLEFADIGVENRGPHVAEAGIRMAMYRGRSAAPPRGPFANGTGSRSRA